MPKWKCTVCGYIHEGDAPPEICPVCGADKSKFVQIAVDQIGQEADGAEEVSSQDKSSVSIPILGTRFQALFRLMIRHHAHPISSHVPNGVIPLIFLFLLLSALLTSTSLGLAALYNMIFVLVALPFVIFSGYMEWQIKYGGRLTGVFKAKITSALLTFLLGLVLTVWFLVDPEVVTSKSIVFIVLALVWLAAVTMAGYLGGKLVFKD